MGRNRQGSGNGQVFGIGGVIPVGKVGNEIERGFAQFLSIVQAIQCSGNLVKPRITVCAALLQVVFAPIPHQPFSRFDKSWRTDGIARIGPQLGAHHRPARRQRPPRPPDMKGGDVAMPNALFPPCMRGDSLDGQVQLDQAFGITCHMPIVSIRNINNSFL